MAIITAPVAEFYLLDCYLFPSSLRLDHSHVQTLVCIKTVSIRPN